MLPHDLHSLRARVAAGERMRYLYFWGHTPARDGQVGASCFSQWFEAGFERAGVHYRTAEHWMMAEKARLFGDQKAEAEIVAAVHPGAAKKLGRSVRGFDEARWQEARYGIVVRGNRARFSQNPALAAFLRGTRSCVLVEASPYDRIWGIGVSRDDPRAADPSSWPGRNLLGFALMEVRERLVPATPPT